MDSWCDVEAANWTHKSGPTQVKDGTERGRSTTKHVVVVGLAGRRRKETEGGRTCDCFLLTRFLLFQTH